MGEPARLADALTPRAREQRSWPEGRAPWKARVMASAEPVNAQGMPRAGLLGQRRTRELGKGDSNIARAHSFLLAILQLLPAVDDRAEQRGGAFGVIDGRMRFVGIPFE